MENLEVIDHGNGNYSIKASDEGDLFTGQDCKRVYMSKDNADRISACINACQGIPTDRLEAAIIKCSICDSPDVVYGYFADGRTQEPPAEGYIGTYFCRKCLSHHHRLPLIELRLQGIPEEIKKTQEASDEIHKG